MPKKGISLQEKRNRILKFFYKKQSVFSIKELEKEIPKHTGISQYINLTDLYSTLFYFKGSMTIKSILNELIEDSLIETDKIGNGVYYWAYESKALIENENELKKLQILLEKQIKNIQKTTVELEKVKETRKESDTRKQNLERRTDLNKQIKSLNEKIKDLELLNGEKVKEMRNRTRSCALASNRWTDNIFAIIRYMKNNRPDINEEKIYEYFNIPDNFDYIN